MVSTPTFIAEPPRSTYHDPMTGKEVRSGPVADIHTMEPVSAHITGSFREIVTQVMDSNPRTAELITADNPQARVGAVSVDGTPSAVYPAKLNHVADEVFKRWRSDDGRRLQHACGALVGAAGEQS